MTTIPLDTRILRQLDECLRAARRGKESVQVRIALIQGAACALEAIEATS